MDTRAICGEIDKLVENGDYTNALERTNLYLKDATSSLNQGALLYEKGKILYHMGEVEKGMQNFAKALNILEGYNIPTAGEIIFHIAAYYLLYGKLDVAMRLYKNVLEIMPEDSKIYIGALHNIGNINRKSGRLKEAVEYFEEIYNMAIKNKDKKGAAYGSENIAECYAMIGEREKTLLWLHRAHENAVMINDSRIVLAVEIGIDIIQNEEIEKILEKGKGLSNKDVIYKHDVADIFYYYSAFRNKRDRKLLLEQAFILYGESGDGIMRSKVEERLNTMESAEDEEYL